MTRRSARRRADRAAPADPPSRPVAIPPSPILPRWHYLAVAVVAVAVQAVQLALLRDDPSVAGPIIDGREYHAEAARLAAGIAPPHLPHFQSPLFPWALSLAYRVAGPVPFAGLFLAALLVLVIAIEVLAIARRTCSPRVALAAGLAASLYGPLLFFASQLIPAPIDAASSLAVLWCALAVPGGGGLAGHLLLGVACGLAVAARGTIAPVVLWLAVRPWRAVPAAEAALRTGALGAGAFLGLAPVAVSNALRCGTFSLATSNLGVNLWVGNNPDWVATTAIRPGWRWDLLMSEPARHGVLSPVDASGWLRDRALAWAASDPLGWLGGLAVKLADTFNGLEVPRNLDPYGDLGRTPLTAALLWDHGLRLPFGLVLPLAVAGLAAWWRMGGDQARAARTFAAFALLDALGIALFFPTGRYRLGLALALLVPAASGAVAVADRLRGRGALPWAGLAAAAVAGLAVNAMPALTGPDLHDEGPIQLALAYESAGRHADARDLLVDEVRRRPDDADAWRLLGQAIAATGDEEGAIAPLRRAVGLAPDFAHAWQHLGGILLNRGRAREAVPPLEKAVEANPGHPLAWVDLASARLRVKDYAGGLAAAREAVRVNPDHPEAWLHLGHALLLTGDPGGAEGPLRRAAAMAPRDPSPRYLLARSLADRARTDEAIAALRDVLARWPGHAASRKLLDRLTGASPAAGS